MAEGVGKDMVMTPAGRAEVQGLGTGMGTGTGRGSGAGRMVESGWAETGGQRGKGEDQGMAGEGMNG